MITEKARFGISTPEFRTDYGTLRTRELEKIVGFLNRRGILIADCFERKIIIVHPSLAKDIQREMDNAGFQSLLIGATVSNLRKSENLSLAQNRVLETLTPGALIINRSDENNSALISVAVPDNLDLRDICSSYESAIQVFITNTNIEENKLIKSLSAINLDRFGLNRIGILEYPYINEDPVERIVTVVYVYGPNDIKIVQPGVYDLNAVRQASSEISQYEIGEWT